MKFGKFEIGLLELCLIVSLLMYTVDKLAPALSCK